MLRKRILDLLCCPNCKNDLDVYRMVISAHDEIKEGILYCPRCCDIKGIITGFRFDFLHFDKSQYDLSEIQRKLKNGEYPIEQAEEAFKYEIWHSDTRVNYIGKWDYLGDKNKYRYSSGTFAGDKMVIIAEFSGFELFLITHPWSGKVKIRVDDNYERDIDLFYHETALKSFSIDKKLDYKQHRIEIIPLCGKNPNAIAHQVVFSHCICETNKKAPATFKRIIKNDGNPFPEGFLNLIKDVPLDGIILDCGGGLRQLDDNRYINFEYTKHEHPDVFGDGHFLPFRDNSFDLVLSQAVMEHMYQPFKGAEEIYRITKKNGILWAEMPFMQPLHAVPYHYFNATVWGIEELFKRFDKLDSGWFGNLSFTFDWMIKCTGIIKQIGENKYNKFLDEFKKWDQYVTHDDLRYVSSGVYFKGIKKPR